MGLVFLLRVPMPVVHTPGPRSAVTTFCIFSTAGFALSGSMGDGGLGTGREFCSLRIIDLRDR